LSADGVFRALCAICIETRLSEGFTTNLTGGLGLHQTTQLDALWLAYDISAPDQRPAVLSAAVAATLKLRRDSAIDPRAESAFNRAQREVEAGEARFVEDLRTEVSLKGDGEHDFKFFGACESIAARLPLAERQRWWAAASCASPFGTSQRWSRADEALALIRELA
jgi:hypothetical protein